MKILHIITSTELGGAQKVCIDLCKSAADDDNIVAVASMLDGYLWKQLPSNVIQCQLRHMVKPLSLFNDVWVLFELRRVVRTFAPDIIHLHSSKAGVLGRLVSIFSSKRIVYTVHGFDSIRLQHRFFLPFEKVLQYCCGAIVAVSKYDMNNLLKEKINRNVYVVHNGITMSSCTNKQLSLDAKGRKVILTVARLAPPKNIELFLRVAEALPECEFVWIGGADCGLDEFRKMHCVPENVVFTGNIPNAGEYIGACDLFVLFSNYEGLPMTIIEAMAQSKAIVASNVGGVSELVDNSNGRLVNNDVQDAVNAISEIIGDQNLNEEMGSNSYEKFKESFTLQKMWNEYKRIYTSLLK